MSIGGAGPHRMHNGLGMRKRQAHFNGYWAGQLLERRHTCCLHQQPFLAAPAQRCCCALAVSWAQAAAEKFNIDVSGCSVLDFLDTSNPLVEK